MALTGGCCCGPVRYRLAADPVDAGWCHCRTCQRNSTSPSMAFATVPVADYRYEAGEALVARFASSEHGRRAFCSRCGTPLHFWTCETPDRVEFSLATLDDPGAVPPGFHIGLDLHDECTGFISKLRKSG